MVVPARLLGFPTIVVVLPVIYGARMKRRWLLRFSVRVVVFPARFFVFPARVVVIPAERIKIGVGIEWFLLLGYVGYIWLSIRLVLPRSASDIVCLSDFAVVCLNMLPSAIVCLFCSRSSPYLCDSVLCTCLICRLSACSALFHLCIYVVLCYAPDYLLLFVYLCSDLSAAVCLILSV
ncbi:hypothetical protein Tco_1300171 [Tanacetum coccineum]